MLQGNQPATSLGGRVGEEGGDGELTGYAQQSMPTGLPTSHTHQDEELLNVGQEHLTPARSV